MELLDYTAPATLDEALEALRATPGARPMGGGHRLILDMKRRARRIPLLVDLGRLDELRGVRRGPDGGLEIGSTTTITDLVADPLVRGSHAGGLLADAAAAMPDAQVRNRATAGGAVVAGADVAAALIALEAGLHLRGGGARSRRVSVERFLAGEGPAGDEVIVAVEIPATTARGAYERLAEPAALSSLCGVAVSLTFRPGGAVGACRVAVCGGPGPARRVPELEDAAAAASGNGSEPRLDGVFESDDVASGEYRAHLARVLARRAVARARDRDPA
ncbi:FAD binding domain-containing protein [Streptosporangium sp. NPDC048047]|uniref:FAD binding domain-containing protein n=1 Tax=Streptosporangium sp. NPDC048047 TaxID=3155748 RepID=UPI00342D4C9A